jgi:predicted HD phosphohydrolase
MKTDWKALCAELTYCWSRTTNPDVFAENAAPIIGRMRAALAQPEPECDHPITPSLELAQQWLGAPIAPGELSLEIFTRAVQWGADQELEACCDVLEDWGSCIIPDLRAARRPKPPSLKEQGLQAIEALLQRTTDPNIVEPLRLAVEALPE